MDWSCPRRLAGKTFRSGCLYLILQALRGASRTPFTEKDWHSRGNEVRKTVYRGVGNAEVHAMLTEWFPELSMLLLSINLHISMDGELWLTPSFFPSSSIRG